MADEQMHELNRLESAFCCRCVKVTKSIVTRGCGFTRWTCQACGTVQDEEVYDPYDDNEQS